MFVGTKGRIEGKMARLSLYQQVAAALRRAIYTGELAPGDQIPTEADLMETYGVSRNTVRLALGELENEGLILRMRRRGTFVRERRPLLMRPQDEIRYLEQGEPDRTSVV